jgi:hypothetical protein
MTASLGEPIVDSQSQEDSLYTRRQARSVEVLRRCKFPNRGPISGASTSTTDLSGCKSEERIRERGVPAPVLDFFLLSLLNAERTPSFREDPDLFIRAGGEPGKSKAQIIRQPLQLGRHSPRPCLLYPFATVNQLPVPLPSQEAIIQGCHRGARKSERAGQPRRSILPGERQKIFGQGGLRCRC